MQAVQFLSTLLNQANITLLHNTQLVQKEGQIALAMQALKHSQFSSVYAAAKAYDVAESTLWGHVKGIPVWRDIVLINQKLTTIEELTLLK